MLKLILLLVFLPLTFSPVFADLYNIETADNDLASPGCLDTDVGCYTPNILTVQTGDIIKMTNTDENGIHTFTSGTVDGFAATADETFDSGILQFGDSFEYTADTAGEFPYYCMLHVWMQGKIIVEGSINFDPLTITTDQSTYHEGTPILISGQLNNSHNGTSIHISLQSPNGYLFPIHNIITDNNIFTITIPTGNNTTISTPGLYTLTAHYGTETASTTFDYFVSSHDIQQAYFIPDEQYLTLSDHSITKWDRELLKWQNAQNRTDSKTEFYYEKLDDAISKNQTNKINLFTEKIGHSIALSSLYDGIIDCLQEQLELLS